MGSATACSNDIEDDIHSELTVFVALDAAVKFSVLKLSQSIGPAAPRVGDRLRRVGAGRSANEVRDARDHRIDAKSGAMYARNSFNTEFAEWVGFFDVDDAARTVTGDRTEFIGRNGTLRNPAALRRTRLSGRVGAATRSVRRDAGDVRTGRRTGARDRVPPRCREQSLRPPMRWCSVSAALRSRRKRSRR